MSFHTGWNAVFVEQTFVFLDYEGRRGGEEKNLRVGGSNTYRDVVQGLSVEWNQKRPSLAVKSLYALSFGLNHAETLNGVFV